MVSCLFPFEHLFAPFSYPFIPGALRYSWIPTLFLESYVIPGAIRYSWSPTLFLKPYVIPGALLYSRSQENFMNLIFQTFHYFVKPCSAGIKGIVCIF